ncbi:MAG: hypothetical protein AAGG69_06240 [Pseudomonadota bacterium]
MERNFEKIPANFRQILIVNSDPFFKEWTSRFLRNSRIVNVFLNIRIDEFLFDEIKKLDGFVFVYESSLLDIAEKIGDYRPSEIAEKISKLSPLILFSDNFRRSWPTHRFPYYGIDRDKLTDNDIIKIDALIYDVLEQRGKFRRQVRTEKFEQSKNAKILRNVATELRDMRLNSANEIIENIEKVANEIDKGETKRPSMNRIQNIIINAMDVLVEKTGGKLIVIAIATSLFTAIGVNSNLSLGLSSAVMLGPDAVKQFFKDIKRNLEKAERN